MKKMITTIALAMVLGGCSSSSVMDNNMWIAKDTVMVEQQAISLSANLWIDMMPKIGETQPLMKEQTLHGALNLSTESQLPADMDAIKVVLRQDGETWILDSEDFELRNHSEEQWEIAFKWQLAFNNSKPMDVAVLLVNSDKEIWLTNQQVMVDTVY